MNTAETVIWHRSNYPTESIGYKIFPSNLEGRERDNFRLLRPAKDLLEGTKGIRILTKAGVQNTGDVLSLDGDTIKSLVKIGYKDRPIGDIRRFLESFIPSPEDRLLARFVHSDRERYHPTAHELVVPAAIETDRLQLLKNAIQELPTEIGNVVDLVHGITDRRPLYRKDVALQMGLETYKVTKLLGHGLHMLHQPKFRDRFKPFLPFPEGSLGRQFFSVDTEYEVRMMLPDVNLDTIKWGDISESEFYLNCLQSYINSPSTRYGLPSTKTINPNTLFLPTLRLGPQFLLGMRDIKDTIIGF